MANAGARRHDAEIREGLLTPAQELITLGVAFVFNDDVLLERTRRAEIVHHHRVVDDEIDFGERIDLLRIPAQRLHRIAHRRQIDHARHARKVLQHDARGMERNLQLGRLGGMPAEIGIGLSAHRHRAAGFEAVEIAGHRGILTQRERRLDILAVV